MNAGGKDLKDYIIGEGLYFMKTIPSLNQDYIDMVKPNPVPKGIRKLAKAMLDLAIKDIEEKDEYCDDAVRWLFSNDINYVFSFLNICHILGLNPERVRRVIKSKLHNYQILPAALSSVRRITRGDGRCRN